MNSSVLLQTEALCVPTQLIFLDLTSDSRVQSHIEKLNELGEGNNCPWVDVMKYSLSSSSQTDEPSDNDVLETKLKYASEIRPVVLKEFNQLYEKRIQQGSKGRLVVWIVADLDENTAMSSCALREIPLDLANLCRWRHKYLPGIIRVALSSSDNTLMRFLQSLRSQYFEMTHIGGKDAFSATRSKSSLEKMIQEQLSSQLNANEEEQKPKLIETVELGSNPFDITLTTRSFDQELAPGLLDRILMLHSYETKYCLAPKTISHEVGSGGQLFVIAEQIVAGMAVWRRLDWLVLAQTQFCPRLWNIADPRKAQELLLLLDYRSWIARFADVDAIGESLVDFPDSSWDEIKDKIDSGITGSFNRRRREPNWSNDLLRTQLRISADVSDYNYDNAMEDSLLGEKNEWRITEDDFGTWQELLICLQRTRNYEKSLEIISKYLRGRPKIPPVFEKFEALALLKANASGSNEKRAKDMLKSYRRKILSDFQDDLLLKGEKGTEAQQAQMYSEIAAVALVDGAAEEAQEYALKALEKDKSLAGAYKTLIWASVRTGKTTLEQEDLIFTFFVSYIRDLTKAEEYYALCVSKHPQVGIYKYAFAVFLQFIVGDLTRAAQQYSAAKGLLDDNPRFLETYSTFLTQTELFGSDPAGTVIPFSPRQAKLFEEIQQMYRKATELDLENIVIKGNLAAFLLASSARIPDEAQAQAMQIEAFRLLDSVLYGSGDLNSKNAALALELWFYSLCYTTQVSKLAEALRHIKALLRRRVRSPGWDLSMHLGFVRLNLLLKSEFSWIEKLADVITMKASVLTLKTWPRWQQTVTDRLVRSPVKNSTGVASVNIGSVLQPEQQTESEEQTVSAALKSNLSRLPGKMLSKTYSKPSSAKRLTSSSSSLSDSAVAAKPSVQDAASPVTRVASLGALETESNDLNASFEDDSMLLEGFEAPGSANGSNAARIEMPSLKTQTSAFFDVALDFSDHLVTPIDQSAQSIVSLASTSALRRQSLLASPNHPNKSKPVTSRSNLDQISSNAEAAASMEPAMKRRKLMLDDGDDNDAQPSKSSAGASSSVPPAAIASFRSAVTKTAKVYSKKK